jgi:hypothetical protein
MRSIKLRLLLPVTLAPAVAGALAAPKPATLACGPADATASTYTTGPAELSEAGHFAIRGPLLDGANAAVLPATCENALLLIRAFSPTTGLPGGWFAAGIPDLDD